MIDAQQYIQENAFLICQIMLLFFLLIIYVYKKYEENVRSVNSVCVPLAAFQNFDYRNILACSRTQIVFGFDCGQQLSSIPYTVEQRKDCLCFSVADSDTELTEIYLYAVCDDKLLELTCDQSGSYYSKVGEAYAELSSV